MMIIIFMSSYLYSTHDPPNETKNAPILVLLHWDIVEKCVVYWNIKGIV